MQQSMPARSRPGLVTAAAIVLIVFGALGTIFGLLGLAVSLAFAAAGGIGILYTVLALVGLALAVLGLVAGIGLLTGGGWARGLAVWVSIGAITVSVLQLVLNIAFASQLETATGVQGATAGAATGGVIGLIIAVAIYGFVLWALNREKAYFGA